jgi:hypothetical protein
VKQREATAFLTKCGNPKRANGDTRRLNNQKSPPFPSFGTNRAAVMLFRFPAFLAIGSNPERSNVDTRETSMPALKTTGVSGTRKSRAATK